MILRAFLPYFLIKKPRRALLAIDFFQQALPQDVQVLIGDVHQNHYLFRQHAQAQQEAEVGLQLAQMLLPPLQEHQETGHRLAGIIPQRLPLFRFGATREKRNSSTIESSCEKLFSFIIVIA